MTRVMGLRLTGRWLRVVSVFALSVSFVVAGAPARACSCVRMDLESRLPDADGAFVGTLEGRHRLSEQVVTISFYVERVVKGEFGPTAIVRSSAHGASCGIELFDGPRTGLLLDRGADGVWESSLCQQVPPGDLLAFAPNAGPPDPTVEAIGPGTGMAWWGYAILGGLAIGGFFLLATRSRRTGA